MKRLILFFIIVGIIGVGIFVLSREREEISLEPQNIETPGNEPEEVSFFEPSQTLVKNIIRDALDVKFNPENASYKVADLDHKGGPELIIGATEQVADSSTRPSIATIQVLTILNRKGEYERLGKIEYQETVTGMPEVKDLQDITSDGVDELFVDLGFGGASNIAHGFFRLDTKAKKLEWIQLRDQNGQLHDASFLMGGTVTHSETVQVNDVNGDGKKEIVELFIQVWEPGEQEYAIPNRKVGETWCFIRAYQWKGALFDFSETLSEQVLQSLGTDCSM